MGNRSQLQTWRGVQNWGYDGLNRNQSLTDIEGGRYTWSYDLHGRLREQDYANGVIFSVTYYAGGGPAQGSYSSAADPQVYLINYDYYDYVRQPRSMHYYWGGAYHTQRFLSYDAANQLVQWSDSDTDGPLVTFDGAGNPASSNARGVLTTYTYDGADAVGNVVDNAPSYVSVTFTYDGSGNRIGEQFYQQGGPAPSLTTYTWDAANHLLMIQQSAAGAVDLTNSYRPDGRRHRRTDSSGTTQMVWDEDELLAQADTAGNLLEFWSWAPSGVQAFGGSGVGALGPAGVEGWGWSRLVKAHFPAPNPNPDQYAHSDGQGTILALSLPAGTALTQTLPPRPWGLPVTGTLTPFSWQGSWGYWREGQLARPLHYVRARWYIDGEVNVTGGTPTGGGSRWLSPDPLGFGGGDWNLYRYVGNRPTVGVDPSGLAYVGSEPFDDGELSGAFDDDELSGASSFMDPLVDAEDECATRRRHPRRHRPKHPRKPTKPLKHPRKPKKPSCHNPRVNVQVGYTFPPLPSCHQREETPSADQYGQRKTVDCLTAVCFFWGLINPAFPIFVGPLSRRCGGPLKPHRGRGHREGLAIDLSLIFVDGQRHRHTTYKNPLYDRIHTQQMINLFRGLCDVAFICFNDPHVSGVRWCAKHDDHVHVEING